MTSSDLTTAPVPVLIRRLAIPAGTGFFFTTMLEVKDDMVVVQKGKDKWEIVKDKDTTSTGDRKVGSKVTVTYTMKAATIGVKNDV